MSTAETTDIKEVVKQKYGEAALRVKSGGSSCCGATPDTGCADPITGNLYDASQIGHARRLWPGVQAMHARSNRERALMRRSPWRR